MYVSDLEIYEFIIYEFIIYEFIILKTAKQAECFFLKEKAAIPSMFYVSTKSRINLCMVKTSPFNCQLRNKVCVALRLFSNNS